MYTNRQHWCINTIRNWLGRVKRTIRPIMVKPGAQLLEFWEWNFFDMDVIIHRLSDTDTGLANSRFEKGLLVYTLKNVEYRM